MCSAQHFAVLIALLLAPSAALEKSKPDLQDAKKAAEKKAAGDNLDKALGLDTVLKQRDEKALRLKTLRQLKEVLTAANVPIPDDAEKSELVDLALKHDALAKWTAANPDKQKQRPGGPLNRKNQKVLYGPQHLFKDLDKDLDGYLNATEFSKAAMFMLRTDDNRTHKPFFPATKLLESFPDTPNAAFPVLDEDSDGVVTPEEARPLFQKMVDVIIEAEEQAKKKIKEKMRKENPAAAQAVDDEELPEHDELR